MALLAACKTGCICLPLSYPSLTTAFGRFEVTIYLTRSGLLWYWVSVTATRRTIRLYTRKPSRKTLFVQILALPHSAFHKRACLNAICVIFAALSSLLRRSFLFVEIVSTRSCDHLLLSGLEEGVELRVLVGSLNPQVRSPRHMVP